MTHYYYGVEDGNDFQAVNIVETSEDMHFDVLFQGQLQGHFDRRLSAGICCGTAWA